MADRSIDPGLATAHAVGGAPAGGRVRRSREARRSTVRGHLVLGVSGVATAAVFAGPGSPSAGPPGRSDKAEANEKNAGVHGGPIERFHNAESCDLTAVGSLPGNWTHGDYVSAIAAAGDATEIREAAWSDCGKPMVAVEHGGGPPEHALEHVAAGHAHAGKADDSGSDAAGS